MEVGAGVACQGGQVGCSASKSYSSVSRLKKAATSHLLPFFTITQAPNHFHFSCGRGSPSLPTKPVFVMRLLYTAQSGVKKTMPISSRWPLMLGCRLNRSA